MPSHHAGISSEGHIECPCARLAQSVGTFRYLIMKSPIAVTVSVLNSPDNQVSEVASLCSQATSTKHMRLFISMTVCVIFESVDLRFGILRNV